MNASEAVDRIVLTFSELSGRFLVGIREKSKPGYFLDKKDMTNNLLVALVDYLEDGRVEMPFTDSKGIKYSLRIIKHPDIDNFINK